MKETTYRSVAGFRCLRNIQKQTSDLFLVHCGHQKCPPGYTYKHKVPNEYHLHFVLEGKGRLEIGGQIYQLHKENIFLIPKNIPIRYFADSEDPWEYIWVTFDGTCAETYLGYAGITADSPVTISAIPVKAYIPMIEKILDTNELTFANEIKRVGYLFETLSMLIEVQSIGKRKHNQYDYSSDTYVEYAIFYINHNYNHIKVHDIANYIGINRSYLTAIFKKKLGISPQEYLVSYRLKKAAEMLTNTTKPIQDIAEMIGYENPLTFSKMFKRSYGLSPTHYRIGQVDNIKIK